MDQHPPPHRRCPSPCDFTVFGGTGDLALRKLLPALYHRDREGQLPADYRIIGVSRTDLDDDGYRAEVREALTTHVAPPTCSTSRPSTGCSAGCTTSTLDADDARRLAPAARPAQGPARTTTRPCGCSTSRSRPQLFGSICQRLDEIGVVDERRPRRDGEADRPRPRLGPRGQRRRRPGLRRVADLPDRPLPRQGERPEPPGHPVRQHLPRAAVELPLGRPRADHRRRDRSASASRGDYYDHAGALRDMVQNHLLQLLCLVAMEPPTYVGRETVRDEKLKVLQALQADDARRRRPRHRPRPVRRRAGRRRRRAVVRRRPRATRARTETFVALRAEVQNWRWAGVPFYLRTGKRMDRRLSEIVVVFKEPPHSMFPRQRGRHRAQPAAHPGPARRGHAPAPDRQGARSRAASGCGRCRST